MVGILPHHQNPTSRAPSPWHLASYTGVSSDPRKSLNNVLCDFKNDAFKLLCHVLLIILFKLFTFFFSPTEARELLSQNKQKSACDAITGLQTAGLVKQNPKYMMRLRLLYNFTGSTTIWRDISGNCTTDFNRTLSFTLPSQISCLSRQSVRSWHLALLLRVTICKWAFKVKKSVRKCDFLQLHKNHNEVLQHFSQKSTVVTLLVREH